MRRSRAPRMYSHPARLDRRNLLLRDHAGIGDQTDPVHREAALQALGHPVEGGHVGGVARPHLAAHRNAVAVDDHPQHHLLAIAAPVLALAVLAQRLAAIAGEEQRGGVEEHQVEVGEQVAAPREQRLLDKVFGAPRRGGIRLGFCERLAEPAHRAVQMLQFELCGAVDGLVTAPLKGAAVGARDHEAVQHGHEHRAFDIEVMVAGSEQLAHDRLAAGLTPQAFEDQCWADRDDVGVGRIVCIGGVLCEHHEALGETSRGAQELVDGAAGGEFVEPAQRCNDGLFDAFAFAAILRDLKILIGADLLDADEHAASPILTPHIVGRLLLIFQSGMEYLSGLRVRIYHYILEDSHTNQPLTPCFC